VTLGLQSPNRWDASERPISPARDGLLASREASERPTPPPNQNDGFGSLFFFHFGTGSILGRGMCKDPLLDEIGSASSIG